MFATSAATYTMATRCPPTSSALGASTPRATSSRWNRILFVMTQRQALQLFEEQKVRTVWVDEEEKMPAADDKKNA